MLCDMPAANLQVSKDCQWDIMHMVQVSKGRQGTDRGTRALHLKKSWRINQHDGSMQSTGESWVLRHVNKAHAEDGTCMACHIKCQAFDWP